MKKPDIAAIKATGNPIRYYAGGEPYFQIRGCEIRNHPAVEALAYLDRLEKYIMPDLLAKLERVTAERDELRSRIDRISQFLQDAGHEDASKAIDCEFEL